MEDNRIRHRRNQIPEKEIEPYKKEIESYKKAIKIDSKNSLAWYNLGFTYFKIGDRMEFDFQIEIYKIAIESFKKVIEIDSKNIQAWDKMGILYSQIENYKKAIESYKKIVEIDSKNIQARYKMGKLYSQIGNYDKAIESYKKIVKIQPKAKYAWENIAYAYDKLGNHEKVAESIEKINFMDRFKFFKKNRILEEKNNDGLNISDKSILTDLSRIFEESNDELEIVSKLIPIIANIYLSPNEELSPTNKLIIEKIYQFDISYKIFKDIPNYLRLLADVEVVYFREYLNKIESDYLSLGAEGESNFIKDLLPTIDEIFQENCHEEVEEIFVSDKYIIEEICKVDISYMIFKDNPEYLKLLAKLDPIAFRKVLNFIENDCQNGQDESLFIDILISIIFFIHYGIFYNDYDFQNLQDNRYKSSIEAICKLDISDKLFKINKEYIKLVAYAHPTYLEVFDKKYKPEDEQDKTKFIKNLTQIIYEIYDDSTIYDEYALEFSDLNKSIIETICKLDVAYDLCENNPKSLLFVARVVPDYLKKFETDFYIQNGRDESKFIDNLIPIIEQIYDEKFLRDSNWYDISDLDKLVIEAISEFSISYKLFMENKKFLLLVTEVDPAYLKKFENECQTQGEQSTLSSKIWLIIKRIYISKNTHDGLYTDRIDIFAGDDLFVIGQLCKLNVSYKIFKENREFLCMVPRDYLSTFMVKMDKERQTQDDYDESKEIDNLISKINDIFYGDYSPEFYEANWNTDVKIHHAPISGLDYGIIKGICDLDISYKLFKDHPHELKLIARNEIDYFRNHLKKFEEECQTDGELNESKFIDYLISIIDSFNSDYHEIHNELFDFEPVSNIDKTLIKIICKLDTSYKILKDNPKYLWLFAQADPDYFDKCFKSTVKDFKIQNNEDELIKEDHFKLYCIIGDIIDAIGNVIDSSCGIKGMKTKTVEEATIEVTKKLISTLDEIHRIGIKYDVFKDSQRYKSILQEYRNFNQ